MPVEASRLRAGALRLRIRHMKRLLNWLSRRRFPYEPLITITISRGRLLRNLSGFRKIGSGAAIAPVLKSNAYGHGLLEIARILEPEPGITFFCVDSYFEAVALRARGIRTPLLIIGYTRPETIAGSRLKRVSFAVSSLETLETIRSLRSNARIHLKIDTGMRRQGIFPKDAARAIEIIEGEPQLCLEGIMTHFADADNDDTVFTDRQIEEWNKCVELFETRFPGLAYTHASNTDGSRYSSRVRANVMRIGIGLYGLSADTKIVAEAGLQPVMEMQTMITGLKALRKGETAGYANTFKADRDMRIATIPVGYYEGLDRRLSNNGCVQVGHERAPCPIIGRVSMNIATIDVTAVGDAGLRIGAPVIAVSRERADPNSLDSMAAKCGTITYELAAKIPAHLKRVVVE